MASARAASISRSGVPASSRARRAGLAGVAQPPRQPAQQQPAHRQHHEDDGEHRREGADGVLRGLPGAATPSRPRRPARRTARPARRRPPGTRSAASAAESMLPATDRPEVLDGAARLGQHQDGGVHGARDQHPDDDPGEHADVGGHLAEPDGGVLGVEVHRCILRRPAGAQCAVVRHGPTRRGHALRRVSAGRMGRAASACLDSARGAPRPGAPTTRWGRPVTLGERPARTRSADDAGRGSPRGQEPGVPGGAHPCRGDRAGAGRARGARRARRGGGFLHPGRRLRGRRARGSSPRPTTCGPTPTCCSRSRSRSRRSTTGCARGQTLFTYLHLAASKECTDALVASGTTAIAYETVQTADGALPLLAPMSEVAGRMAPQVGAHSLERAHGGRGVLLGGVSGRVRREGRRHRRRRLRHERRRDRAGHAGRGRRPRPRHRQAARRRPHLPGPPADRRLQRLRGGAGGARRRPGHRRGAGAPAPRRRCWSATSWSAG